MTAGGPAASLRRDLGLLPLAAVIFFNVSGGPYGIEDAVSSFGPGLALLLLILAPLVWSLPVTLVMAELSSALPDEGGYVTWVRRAFGPFWAFQVGWWSWVDSFVDIAVYPALFTQYLAHWGAGMTSLSRWLIALAFIWILTGLNIRGVRVVGVGAVGLGLLALAPIAALVIVGAGRVQFLPWEPLTAGRSTLVEGLGLGLAVVMWNYSGWDTPTTCLGETRSPERAFRRALGLTLPLITLAYVLPVGVGLAAAGGWQEWGTGALPRIGAAIGGSWLGGWITLGAALSTAGLFLSLLLTNSRLPFVLAQAGQLPSAVGRIHTRYGTPWVAVILSSVIYSAFAAFGFKELVVLDNWLYSLSLLVELAAFLALRRREPGLRRPWRVPGGRLGALLAVIFPSACALLAMATAGLLNTAVAVAVALTGPLAYLWVARASDCRR
ncbi:MAG: APC family permease [Candidatus Rokubacteria bacterium]|nr:APC family permease [Candidatus Rokubacteria bacterium]